MKHFIFFFIVIIAILVTILSFKLGEFTGRSQAIKELNQTPKTIEAKGGCSDLVADMRVYHKGMR